MQNKYPLWKNIALIVLALLGLLYAIPNLFGEDPVIQISSQTSMDTNAVSSQVKNLLDSEKIHYKALSTSREDSNRVEVRFASTDTQLAAQSLIKNKLGSNYTVALNLMPTTPAWLQSIHAEPMKQGLDLRGGIHFLLEVDVNSVVSRHYEGLMKNISQDLRQSGIRYSGIRMIPEKGISLQFRTPELMKAAEVQLNKAEFSNIQISKSELANTLLVNFIDSEKETFRKTTMEQTMTILRNRVNELGVGEAVVQQQGATRIGVDLPGIQDAAKAKQILGGTATLQFFMVDEENDPGLAKQTGAIPLNSKLYLMRDGRPLLLKRQMVLSGDSITSAVSTIDQQTGENVVSIQLGGGGESFFTKTTRENIGKRMAIVFMETKTRLETINNKVTRITKREESVISAPVIQSTLYNQFQITGMKDVKEATDLALLLRAGALPAVIYPVEERIVGPSLGKENIRRGLVSLEVGMGLILILMLVYYRFFGLVANIALFLNLILLSALLSLIGATLTLPGIAAFVLTVGMAVDANVLINERIREELRNGMSPQAAIFAGYDRAFSTIIDANVTTLIVGIVLFSIGTGPIRGFAVILSLGLLTSMLTSITYTRAIVNWYYGGRTVKKLSIGI